MAQKRRKMETPTKKVSVQVGSWSRSGAFTGETLRFTGEKIGSWKERQGELGRPGYRIIDYTLYKVGGSHPGYRVHIEGWNPTPPENRSATLEPNDARKDSSFAVDDPMHGKQLNYSTFTEEEARRAYPNLYAALGLSNVRDLD